MAGPGRIVFIRSSAGLGLRPRFGGRDAAVTLGVQFLWGCVSILLGSVSRSGGAGSRGHRVSLSEERALSLSSGSRSHHPRCPWCTGGCAVVPPCALGPPVPGGE